MRVSNSSSALLVSRVPFNSSLSLSCLFQGFKYIGNTAIDLVRQGFEVPFGYEEAIGFMFGSYIRDKDGIAATVCITLDPMKAYFSFIQMVFAETVVALRLKDSSVKQHLEELYTQ